MIVELPNSQPYVRCQRLEHEDLNRLAWTLLRPAKVAITGGAMPATESERAWSRSCMGQLKRRWRIALAALLVVPSILLTESSANADVISCGSGASCTTNASGVSAIGSFSTPEDVFLETFTLAATTSVTVQTYGFGGGTNAAGIVVAPSGFDSLVALFSGPPTSASILMSGGNSIASDPATTQFFSGCPPAGTVVIGGESICGDNTLTATLAAGGYTLLLSDADYEPFAFNPGDPSPYDLTSASSYGDLTGGVFQTCNSAGACISPNGNFAVDLLAGTPTPVPEPGTLLLLSSAVAALMWRSKRSG
ncbi:MAG TPA: DVUA0089 family protein [Burkholderiales bacterium]|nr:DVUA0089 family protein [Burkholderiales bacterium]